MLQPHIGHFNAMEPQCLELRESLEMLQARIGHLSVVEVQLPELRKLLEYYQVGVLKNRE